MFILTLWANPLTRKILIGAGISLAVFYALRLWSNRVYSEGFKSGKTAGLAEMEAAKSAEWQAKADAIAADAARTAADRRVLEAETSALADSRRQRETTLSRSLKQMNARKEADSAKVASVPDSDLDSALRAISAVLAGAAAKQ